jgi:Mrp family chromosome partitioning ATPase
MWMAGRLHTMQGAYYDEEWLSFLDTQTLLLESARVLQGAWERIGRPSLANWAPSVQAELSRKASVIELTCRGPDARLAGDFLDAVMQEYLAYRREVRGSSVADNTVSLTEQLARYEAELQVAEETLTQVQATNDLGSLHEEGAAAVEYLTALHARLADLRMQESWLALAPSDEIHQWLAGMSALPTLSGERPIRSLIPAGGVDVTAYQQVNEALQVLRLEREERSRSWKPQHPKMLRLEDEIHRREQLLETFREQGRNQVASVKQALQLEMTKLDEARRDWEARLIALNRRVGEFERVAGAAERARRSYEELRALVQKAENNRNLDVAALTVLDRAAVKPAPWVSPQSCGVALVAGLLAGLLLGLALEWRGEHCSGPADLASAFGEPVLGEIPEAALFGADGRARLPEATDARRPLIESLRNLRSTLLFPTPSHSVPATVRISSPWHKPLEERPTPARCQVLLLSSASPEEGKSTVALCLARTLALTGSRVLLVDATLRHPRLHTGLGTPAAPGLCECLQGLRTPGEVVLPPGERGFAFIPAGSPQTAAGELMVHPRWETLLGWARGKFDHVLIDTPPLLGLADGLSLAPRSDGVVIVVRARRTRLHVVREAVNLLRRRCIPIAGFVLNRTRSVATGRREAPGAPTRAEVTAAG